MKKEEIEAVKRANPIREVVGRYIELKRQGRGHIGRCPFHDDHHPSLYVDDEKQTFMCYSCGEHGDVIAFVQKKEGCTFTEAVAKLHPVGMRPKKPGVAPHTPRADEKPSAPTVADNEKFLHQLMPYASGDSELTPAYMDFEVGRSPAMTDKAWKAMANRLVFPIRNEAGLLVAFGARRLTDENPEMAKYINSSTSDLYKKSETLYALYRAKEAIREEDSAFIVEGYKDALAMHAAGYRNTVALCGTALTEGHVTLLKRYTDRVYLLLDGDEAGRKGAEKAMRLLTSAGMEAESIRLAEGDDPDALFRRLGKEAFRDMLQKVKDRPHTSEYALMTACLLYPEATFPYEGERRRFVDLLQHLLNTEQLAFEDNDHRDLLSYLSEGAEAPSMPDHLWLVSDSLRAAYEEPMEKHYRKLCRMADCASLNEEQLSSYLRLLLYGYTEVRILREIRRLSRRLKNTAPSLDKSSLLHEIAARREQLKTVSGWLERPASCVVGI